MGGNDSALDGGVGLTCPG